MEKVKEEADVQEAEELVFLFFLVEMHSKKKERKYIEPFQSLQKMPCAPLQVREEIKSLAGER